MDRHPTNAGRSSLHQQAPIPPWRNNQTAQPQRGPNRVDSWRSYRNDATSLTPTLDATAPSFEPSSAAQQPPKTYYTPYEPLRVSNGTTERTIVEAANAARHKGKKHKNLVANIQAPIATSIPTITKPQEPSAKFASRYPVRANRGQPADRPIPSIEVPEGPAIDRATFTNALKQRGQTRRSRTKSPVAPETTADYRAQAQKEPVKVQEPRKLLVVLDLNGTLLYRTKTATTSKVHMRPGVTPFLDYLFENHVVMVYTSTMPVTATQMVNQFLHPKHRSQLAAIWARDKLDLTNEQYFNKVQVYKKLDKIWNDESIQRTAGVGNRWNQSNTVLVDDSHLKALAQPHNLLQVPEYTSNDDPAKNKNNHKQVYKVQQDIVKQLELKLDELKYQEDISRLIRKWQKNEAQVPQIPGQQVVVEESMDQKKVKKEGEITKTSKRTPGRPQPHLLTPDSTRDGDSIDDAVQTSDDGDARATPLSPESLRQSSVVSSIDENVFRELLEGTGK